MATIHSKASQATAIVFMTNKCDAATRSRFQSIARQPSDKLAYYVLVDADAPDCLADWEHWVSEAGYGYVAIKSFRFSENARELGIALMEPGKLVPGNTHVPIISLATLLAHEFFWVVEDDVVFTGSWSNLIERFEADGSDLLCSHLNTFRDIPNWPWWQTLRVPANQVKGAKTSFTAEKGFFPFYRISRRALNEILLHHKSGWVGHYECLIPMVLRKAGLRINDLNSVGHGIIYSQGTVREGEGQGNLSSLRYRPDITESEIRSSHQTLIFHPVKTALAASHVNTEAGAKPALRYASPPLISICLATFNGAQFIEEQLRSIARQGLKPFEVLISDDCSDDGTYEILQKFANASSSRIRLHRNKTRLGWQMNFFQCAQAARGEVIAFCDQDDVWEPNKLMAIADAMRSSHAVCVSHNFTLMDEKGRALGEGDYFSTLKQKGFVADVGVKGCAMGVRRSFIEDVGCPPRAIRMSHDFWFGFLSSAIAKRAILPEVLIRHRIHGGNASGWIPDHSDEVPGSPSHHAPSDLPQSIQQLINLYMKPHNLHWTRPLLRALSRLRPWDAHRQIEVISRVLIANHNWHASQNEREGQRST